MNTKKNCYHESWRSKDMREMGYLFECCVEYCKKLFGVDIDRMKFLNAFMRARIRYEMETGHPQILTEAAIDTVERFIEVDCDGDIEQFKAKTIDDNCYAVNQWYWVGWAYAYIHCEADILSAELVELSSIETMLNDYYCGHEENIANYYEKMSWRLANRKTDEEVIEFRKELAKRWDVPEFLVGIWDNVDLGEEV